MPRKKKTTKRPPRKREYDVKNGILRMDNREGQAIEYSFIGLSHEVIMKLAMVGAGSLLCKVEKPLALWERIRQNKFGPRRNYSNLPKVVHAIARVTGNELVDVVAYWKGASKEKRLEWKRNPQIQRELLIMKAEAIDETTADTGLPDTE